MDPRIEQRLQAMYGNQSSPHGAAFGSKRSKTDDLIAKYSRLSSDSSVSTTKSSKLHNVSLIEIANSFGEQGMETMRVEKMSNDITSKYQHLDQFPGLAESLSAETADLIKKATAAKRDAGASLHGSPSYSSPKSHRVHLVTPPADDKVQRMLYDARHFQDYLEQSEAFSSSQSHATPPSSNRSTIKDPPCDAHEEAQRLLQHARKFEAEINRVALEPPECYLGPKRSTRLDGMQLRGYDAPAFGEDYSGKPNGYSQNSDNSSVKSSYDFNSLATKYGIPPKRFSSDYMNCHNTNSSVSSMSSFRSNNSITANSTSMNPILKDLNIRSKELKELLDREKNIELTKTASTWSDVRLNDIDSRLEYLKKRCSDLRQCTEMPGKAAGIDVKFEGNANVNQGHSIVPSPSCDKSVSRYSIKEMKSLELVSSILDEKAAQVVKPVALKVLSERVLGGYRITRETCAKCGVSKLAKRDCADTQAECVFCPINDLRTQIRNGVARKILASKLLMGETTLSRGKLCELCVSPTLVQPDGTVICEVCPVLDAVCLEVAKEQSLGGKIIALPCRECRASTISTNNEVKCVACTVMKEWQHHLELRQQERNTSTESHPQEGKLEQKPSTLSDAKPHGIGEEAFEKNSPKSEEKNDPILSDQQSTPQHPSNKPKIFESLMGQCGVLSNNSLDKDVPLNISNLQSQLLQELAKAKHCQIVLENSLEDPKLKEAGSQAPSPKELEEELAKAKRCQYALQRIIETTSNMDQFPSVEDTPPEIDDMMSAPDLKGSFSISQQEVEAGQPKEYIPPPSFFRSGIPSMVEVTLITPAPDSNLAQAYETNLKNTDNDKKLVSKSRVGIDFWPFTKAVNENDLRREEEQGGFDYDTIQTDDFTVDYTLNTMDDSRLEYLHIKSTKKVNRVRFQDEEEELEREAQARGCSFINCFGCGGNDENEGRQDDVYSRQERDTVQRENPTTTPDKYEPPSRSNSNECSATSTPSNSLSQNTGPAWIGGSNNNTATQAPPAANNDYSEISDVSEHVLRSRPTRNTSDRYEVNGGGAVSPTTLNSTPKRNGASDYSAVSDISGSVNRVQDANSISSGNSGSFVKPHGRYMSGPNRRYYGERFSSKMGTLMEDESVDTSIDKYMLNPSMSGNSTDKMRRIIRDFERANPSSFGM